MPASIPPPPLFCWAGGWAGARVAGGALFGGEKIEQRRKGGSKHIIRGNEAVQFVRGAIRSGVMRADTYKPYPGAVGRFDTQKQIQPSCVVENSVEGHFRKLHVITPSNSCRDRHEA